MDADRARNRRRGGYQVAWKMDADRYVLWTIDGNGNWLSQSAFVIDIRSLLQSAEPALPPGSQRRRHDRPAHDGDRIDWCDGLVPARGHLSLSGTTLTVLPAPPVTAGQFGAWTPIAAEQTAGGYEVAWKMRRPVHPVGRRRQRQLAVAKRSAVGSERRPGQSTKPTSIRTSTATARSAVRRPCCSPTRTTHSVNLPRAWRRPRPRRYPPPAL